MKSYKNPERKEKVNHEGKKNQVTIRFLFHIIKCEKTIEHYLYRVLGETKVGSQELCISPSDLSYEGRKKKDVPRYSGTQKVYTFISSMPNPAL